jgi:hypothetical protein
MQNPNFDLETVAILSTIRRDGDRNPLRGDGSISKRANGASVSLVVKPQTVTERVSLN